MQPMPRWEVRSNWHIGESREFELAPSQIEDFVADALRRVTGQEPIVMPDAPHEWIVPMRRAFSLYDQWALEVTIAPVADGMRTKVTADVSFDASASRIDTFVMTTSSVVGIPLAFGWRAQSQRSARKQAEKLFAEIWKALAPRVETSAYR